MRNNICNKLLQSILIIFSLTTVVACSSGGSPTTNPQLVVSSNESAANYFLANSGESATHLYEVTLNGFPTSSLYGVSVRLPNTQFSIVSNNCQNITGGSSCNIQIQFLASSTSGYSESNVISFDAVGYESSLVVASMPRTITIPTQDYQPGDKTAVMASVGGGPAVLAEVDTGSVLTVINESMVGANITYTGESLTLYYGGGVRAVSGRTAYGSVSFVTSSGQTISTSPNTPLLVAGPNTPVNSNGGPNQIILGVNLPTQVSSRLFLPFPYNQMFVLNRSLNTLVFGQLTPEEISKFNQIPLNLLPDAQCTNYGIATSMTNTCWATESIQVSYTYRKPDGSRSVITYNTLFDSGAGNGSVQFELMPDWLILGQDGSTIENILQADANTLKNETITAINLPLPNTIFYQSNNTNKVNIGNQLFNSYQVLYDQADGIIGLRGYNDPY